MKEQSDFLEVFLNSSICQKSAKNAMFTFRAKIQSGFMFSSDANLANESGNLVTF